MQKHSTTRTGMWVGATGSRRAGRPITVLTSLERRVLALLREADAGDAHEFAGTPDMDFSLCETLARLAQNVRDNGLIVFGMQSRFVSDDEFAILSWLSMLQRPSQSGRWRMANPLQETLRKLAQGLLRGERRLPARSMLADARLEREDCLHVEFLPENTRKAKSRAGATNHAQGAAASAVALVERHRFVTASQFRESGISTQKLSRLCSRGYVERVSLGLYKKPGATDAMLAS
ncbi:type IV toxin-antitoxin system AbiEi family antitoxin domain-containing protein [Novosphingobium resinovorum]|uniref:type IV toxin-antitoxin system AbiEi family antitoxin domain-containing protein n=1 Tax=Novosphingobium resinovorum TaxID=158500 RepID=UPI002ED188CA|nr:type IV toxin-antitoxin system AbiEi family antitoxin domain-containing protein [Novosphingobium resinovorum]